MLLEDTRNQNAGAEVLYHKDIGFPEWINMPQGFQPVMSLKYSGHAQKAATDDRYGNMQLPPRVDVRKGETIEVGVTGRTVTKMVIRFAYDQTRDIIMVIMPASSFVKTVWFNLKTDQHTTLDHSKYANPNSPAPRA